MICRICCEIDHKEEVTVCPSCAEKLEKEASRLRAQRDAAQRNHDEVKAACVHRDYVIERLKGRLDKLATHFEDVCVCTCPADCKTIRRHMLGTEVLECAKLCDYNQGD